jgi:hypothetical protein
METTNLRPALAFVEAHLPLYQANLDRYLQKEVHSDSREWVSRLKFENAEFDQTLQIEPQMVKELYSRLSPALLGASKLESVDYAWQKKVIAPVFNEDGSIQTAHLVLHDAFPGQYHPQRVFVGWTDGRDDQKGKMVRSSFIPPSVSENPEAVRMYQAHVMLHEFFHTIELPIRSTETASQLLLDSSGRSFADWRRDFVDSLEEEPQFTSEYGEVYRDGIFQENGRLKEDIDIFGLAVSEQMAESFVAYHLDIISNAQGYRSFRSQSFGNARPQDQLLKHGGQSKRFGLLKEFCDPSFIQRK